MKLTQLTTPKKNLGIKKNWPVERQLITAIYPFVETIKENNLLIRRNQTWNIQQTPKSEIFWYGLFVLTCEGGQLVYDG